MLPRWLSRYVRFADDVGTAAMPVTASYGTARLLSISQPRYRVVTSALILIIDGAIRCHYEHHVGD